MSLAFGLFVLVVGAVCAWIAMEPASALLNGVAELKAIAYVTRKSGVRAGLRFWLSGTDVRS